jgi:putative toxin-antitoxin system antitoxin component (TIGR02293 family)
MATITSDPDEFIATAQLLKLDDLMQPIESDLDLSLLIERGIPRRCIQHLMSRTCLGPTELMPALNISARKLRIWTNGRRPDIELLEPLHSAQLWTLASVFARAQAVMGSQPEALAWLRRPSIGLAGRAPADLLATSVGANTVLRLLHRIDTGVYV